MSSSYIITNNCITTSLQCLAFGEDVLKIYFQWIILRNSKDVAWVPWQNRNTCRYTRNKIAMLLQAKRWFVTWLMCLISSDHCSVHRLVWQTTWKFHTALFTALQCTTCNCLQLINSGKLFVVFVTCRLGCLFIDLFNCLISLAVFVDSSVMSLRLYLLTCKFPVHLAWCVIKLTISCSEKRAARSTAGWMQIILCLFPQCTLPPTM